MPQWFEGRWECRTRQHNKFYEIHAVRGTYGEEYECTYGPIGSSGTNIIKNRNEVMKKVNEFSRKQYIQVSGAGSEFNSEHNTTTKPKTKPVEVKSRLASIDSDDEPEVVEPKVEEPPRAKGRLGSI